MESITHIVDNFAKSGKDYPMLCFDELQQKSTCK